MVQRAARILPWAAAARCGDLAERRQHRRGLAAAGCCKDAAWGVTAPGCGGHGEGGGLISERQVVCVMAAPTFC